MVVGRHVAGEDAADKIVAASDGSSGRLIVMRRNRGGGGPSWLDQGLLRPGNREIGLNLIKTDFISQEELDIDN